MLFILNILISNWKLIFVIINNDTLLFLPLKAIKIDIASNTISTLNIIDKIYSLPYEHALSGNEPTLFMYLFLYITASWVIVQIINKTICNIPVNIYKI